MMVWLRIVASRVGIPGAASLRRWWALAGGPLCLVLFVSGCVGFTPVNQPLETFDPNAGYRPSVASNFRGPGHFYLLVAFSGGGTRAAALAYGVLEELRDTVVVIDGEEVRLIDEVDTLSGVSGGSFPAAYYGVFGDRIFEEFEPRFLKKNVQGELILEVFKPSNLIRLFTPATSRSQLASNYYDEHLFEGATFADLGQAQGPRVYINATDLSRGDRFLFSQGQFDLLCSDLDALPLGAAVAASSAVPGLLSPITLENYAGTCEFEDPAWLQEALESRDRDRRRWRAARSLTQYLDRKERPWIHLIDGGVSDNLGLRASLETVALAGGADEAFGRFGLDPPTRLVQIVVNAETDPNPLIDLKAAPPGLLQLMNAVSGGQIRRYNFETVLLAQSNLERAASQLATPERAVEAFFIEASFDAIDDPKERLRFKGMPTSFVLSDEQIDALRGIGRQLLRDSPEFQKLIASF